MMGAVILAGITKGVAVACALLAVLGAVWEVTR